MEYRLSHDSVFLARQIFEHMSGADLAQARALDICAGGGIIGMDFLFHRRAARENLPQTFDFIEVQNVYLEHFNENKKRLGPVSTELNFLWCNYDILQNGEFTNVYNLIVCNPPYFLPGRGVLSPSEFKNRCRFFIDSDLKNLLAGLSNSLKPGGLAFMTLRDLPEHGLDILAEAREFSKNKLLIENIGDIRGTFLLRIATLKT